MSAVVGCEACGEFKQVSADRIATRCSCGGVRSLVLTVEQNKERWRRGIPLEQWLAAPRAPPTFASCPREGPCPHVRCKHHQGVPGQHGCDLRYDGQPQTLAHIARVLGASSPSTPANVIANVRRRGVTLPNVPEDDEGDEDYDYERSVSQARVSAAMSRERA